MKKLLIIGSVSLLFVLTMFHVNTSQNVSFSFTTILSDIEALAAGGESSSEGHRCGRAAYEWDEGTTNTTQCAKGCPDKKGTNIKYKNC